jgi:hypothetical protein
VRIFNIIYSISVNTTLFIKLMFIETLPRYMFRSFDHHQACSSVTINDTIYYYYLDPADGRKTETCSVVMFQ